MFLNPCSRSRYLLNIPGKFRWVSAMPTFGHRFLSFLARESSEAELTCHPSNRQGWFLPLSHVQALPQFGDRKGTAKKLCDKDFAERSGELSGAICLKTLVLLITTLIMTSNPLELFRNFFGAVRANFWLCGSI